MRAIGLVGILVALAIVGLLAKRQLATPPRAAPDAGIGAPAAQNPQQVQQHIQQQVERLMQQPRTPPEEPAK